MCFYIFESHILMRVIKTMFLSMHIVDDLEKENCNAID